MQVGGGPSELCSHCGKQRFVTRGHCSGGRGRGRGVVGARGPREQEQTEDGGLEGAACHRTASLRGTAGAGKRGGRSCPFCRRVISIWLTRMLGLDADTGTQPDSAPQTPLNTAKSFAAASMR